MSGFVYVSPFGLLISLLMTLIVYLIVPLTLIVSKKKYKKRKLKLIMILSGIGGYVFFSILFIVLKINNTANLWVAFLWSSIGYWILKKTSCDEENVEASRLRIDDLHEQESPSDNVLKTIEKHHTKEISNEVESNIEVPQKSLSIKAVKKHKNKKLVLFSNVLIVLLTIVSMISIVGATTYQDPKRAEMEYWDTSVVYLILLLSLGLYLSVAIYSLIRVKYKLLLLLSLGLIAVITVVGVEGSVFSENMNFYFDYYLDVKYINSDVVSVLNKVWLFCIILMSLISFIPALGMLIERIIYNRHKSIRYREKCYKRVEKMKDYLDKGIISEKEYERNREEILKKIKS